MSRPPRRFPLSPSFFLALALAPGASDLGAAQIDPLLELVPPDAALTIMVEDLRGHYRNLKESPLVEKLGKLASVERWLSSGDALGFRRAVGRIERVLGTSAASLRDELLGEAFVLSLRLPDGARPEAARGLLLARVPNPSLLDRLIEGVNAAQSGNGELLDVGERTHGKFRYASREFRRADKPSEFYVKLPGRVFAWSNSEDLIRSVIDRQTRNEPGLADLDAVREVYRRLPERPLVAIDVDPRFVETLLAAASPAETPEDQRSLALLTHYLQAVRRIGVALTWQGAPVLHVEERLDPGKLPESLRRWAALVATDEPAIGRVSPSAMALATVQIDATALLDGLLSLSVADPERLDALWTAARGMALGLDPRDEVLPHLGPLATLCLHAPTTSDRVVGDNVTPFPLKRLPWVLTMQVARTPGGVRAANAIDNALKTLVALAALDSKNAAAGLRLETHSRFGTSITSLGSQGGFAFAIADGRVVLGSTVDEVGRALDAQRDARGSNRFESLRARGFPEATSFACVDLRALHAFAAPRRDGLARLLALRQNRDESETRRDLDEALALIGLFDACYLTSNLAPDSTRAHRTIGLMPREPNP